MYDILPLAHTKVDWPIFTKTCKETLGRSPTRGIDSAGIKLDDFCSYLSCLDLSNDPLNQLREGDATGSFEHVHFSFITVSKGYIVIEMLKHIKVLSHMIDIRNDEYMVILTADMGRWKRFVINCAREDAESELRLTACRIMNHFEVFGFKEIWSKYTKKQLNDQSFILVRR